MRKGRPAGKRHEEFASVSDQSWEKGQPPQDRELARLAGIAAALRTLSNLASGPRPRFRRVLRRRLVASAAQRRDVRPTHPPATGRRGAGHRAGHRAAAGGHRRIALGVALLIIVTIAAVANISAAGALPGDPFYGVKRAAQSTTLVLATSERTRGERQLDLAAARLREIRQLVERDSGHVEPAIATALRDMDTRTRAGSATLTDMYRHSLDIRPLNKLDAFARDQRSRLAALLPALPGETRSRARESLRLVESVGDRAVTLLARSCRTDGSCATTPRAA